LYFFWLGQALPRCLVRFFLHVQQEPYRSEGEDKACEATDNTPSHRTIGAIEGEALGHAAGDWSFKRQVSLLASPGVWIVVELVNFA